MQEVGDTVLVMPSFGENVAVPLGNVNVGDSVILYPLKDGTKIAVPILSLSINSFVFNTPSFQFAGFNWKIDFDINLIPLILFFEVAPSGTYWLGKIDESYTTYSPSLLNAALGPNDGQCTYFGQDGWFIASVDIPPGYYIPNNGTITIYESTRRPHIDIWSFSNLYSYIDTPWISPITSAKEQYYIWIILPNKIKVYCSCPHNIGPGNIDAIKLTIP